MSHVIALVDGSLYAHSVCDHAAWIAGRTGASVELLHVLGRREAPAADADLSGSIALGARTALLQELTALDAERAKLSQRRGRAILEDAKARIESAGGCAVTTRLRFGDVVETVAELEADADMVVIGKRGEAADFARGHLGSNLERVARASHRPVLVAARAFRPIARVLIAYDGGTSSMKAVDHVARSPLFAGLACTLLSAGPDNPETARGLANARAMLEAGGHAAETAMVPGQPETVISEAVEASGIDLLVMGAYGHSRIRSLILGSTTTQMIQLCRIPVLLFR
ncbi:universal stress protein [Oceanibacterium hippocampi]|uniref:Universal stress protein family protein n=1 Tax=Oceanibacterium hippocampi TaxID=745714 RepID=A0A1Y5S1V5_9PROT|nr:universal stress protein [Oceanibacterium hippocampi]SLN30737.1 Universal stress protein family protein [Oceanibacterium hippocampi]